VRSLEEAEARRAAADKASGVIPHTLSEEEEVAPRDSTEQSSRLTHEGVLEVGDMVETWSQEMRLRMKPQTWR
jgi:hypothetical protein